MTVLPLIIAPDPQLKICSEAVQHVDNKIRTLVDDMLETMYACGGIGLAAVQVGVHKRVLVMDLEQRETGEASNPLIMINPEIIESSDETNAYEEGCLSFPGQYAEVKRPKTVKVRFLDYDGNTQEMDADDLFATCVQHEIDHLNGIVFVDYLSSVKRDVILRKVKKAKRATKNVL